MKKSHQVCHENINTVTKTQINLNIIIKYNFKISDLVIHIILQINFTPT